MVAEEFLQEVLAGYDFGAPVVGAERFGSGHINDTFCVHTQPPEADCVRFILQRMSPVAFKRPDAGGLVSAVAECLATGGDLRMDETTAKHAAWAEGFRARYTITANNA